MCVSIALHRDLPCVATAAIGWIGTSSNLSQMSKVLRFSGLEDNDDFNPRAADTHKAVSFQVSLGRIVVLI